MSVDSILTKYREAKSILQSIIDSGVQTKEFLIKELNDDLSNVATQPQTKADSSQPSQPTAA